LSSSPACSSCYAICEMTSSDLRISRGPSRWRPHRWAG
jgi:hypothetical protein